MKTLKKGEVLDWTLAMKKTIWINIVGESFPVLFDGERVTTPEFPDISMGYNAPCGTRVTQEILIEACKNKIKTHEK